MANPQHLVILDQGVPVWNKWTLECHRQHLPGPDLSDAELQGRDLREVDFRGVNLAYANLRESDLRRAWFGAARLFKANLQADLRSANFRSALLNLADLSGADLRGANFHDAVLDGASFRRTSLGGADLRGARFGSCDLTEAHLSYTVFGLSDLSAARGLETVIHLGPSTIGIDMVYRSRGKIPEVFLRGAGVPEEFIVYIRSLVANPIEFYSCFISYSATDQKFAERLHTDLQGNGVRCWFAPEDLKVGEKFRTLIDESIRVYDKLVVVLSENSIQSPWVEEEVEAALEKERKQQKLVLFPIRLDDAVMETAQAWAASLRRSRHIGDFRSWKDHDSFRKVFERLLRDLKSEKGEGKVL